MYSSPQVLELKTQETITKRSDVNREPFSSNIKTSTLQLKIHCSRNQSLSLPSLLWVPLTWAFFLFIEDHYMISALFCFLQRSKYVHGYKWKRNRFQTQCACFQLGLTALAVLKNKNGLKSYTIQRPYAGNRIFIRASLTAIFCLGGK